MLFYDRGEFKNKLDDVLGKDGGISSLDSFWDDYENDSDIDDAYRGIRHTYEEKNYRNQDFFKDKTRYHKL